jgi:hypothetical protein
MSRVASILVRLSTSLWFGGMIFLFIAVQTLFRAFPRPASEVAPQAAPALFAVFERYQLALAAVALLSAFAWYVTTRSGRVIVLFALLALAATGAAVSTALITPRMEQLRTAGQSSSSRFKALHARSMQCYVAQAALLLVSVLMLPATAAAPKPKAADSRTPDSVPH